MIPRAGIAVALVLALVAACGSDRSPAPPTQETPTVLPSSADGSTGVATPAAVTQGCAVAGPTASGAGGEQPDAAAPTIERALDSLAQVRSYHAALAHSSIVGGSPGIPTGTTLTVVRSPEIAFDSTTAAVGEEGTPYTFATRAIGTTAWRTADGYWYPEFGTAAELLPTYLGPQDFDAFATVVAGTRVADEVRSGRPAIHWRTTSRETRLDRDLVAIETGDTFTIDLWVDAALGYAVSVEICDSGTLASGTAFQHTTRLEVTRVDDPLNAVTRPTLWSETH